MPNFKKLDADVSCLQELHISNTQFAILDTSGNFIKTALILISGILTDRYGGASTSGPWLQLPSQVRLTSFQALCYGATQSSALAPS